MRGSTTFSETAYSKMGYIISTDPNLLNVAMIHRYLSEQSYWAHGRSREVVERSIQHSLCFGVYSGNAAASSQIGFARIISDYATFAYLADVFILPDHQGQGLGNWLVETMLNHPELQEVRRWALYTENAQQLYSRFGFDAEQEPQQYMSFRRGPDLVEKNGSD